MSLNTLHIIKLGGDVVDDSARRRAVFENLQQLRGSKLLVHGGGKGASQLSEELGVITRMVEGRRVTDADTLRIVTMVYAGLINKELVAELQSMGINAIGLSGVDADLIRAHKRPVTSIDYGFVGDVDHVNSNVLMKLLLDDMTPVIAPITHDGQGQLLNTNADTIASRIAAAMSEHVPVQVRMLMDKAGVLRDVNDDNSVLSEISMAEYHRMRESGQVNAGMIAKLDNAFELVALGIDVLLCSWRDFSVGTRVIRTA